MKHHETLPPNRTELIGSQFPARTRNINITVERFFKEKMSCNARTPGNQGQEPQSTSVIKTVDTVQL